jgi:hypothetical protein
MVRCKGHETTRVSVPVATFQAAALPMVCAKTGAVADRMVCVQATTTASWTWWLLLGGPLPLQAARWLVRRRITGWIPMAARPAARLRRIRCVSLLGLAVGILAVLVGMLTGWPGLARLAVAGWALAIAAAMAEPISSIGARLDPSTGEVLLTRVHPKFGAAVHGVVSGTGDEYK